MNTRTAISTGTALALAGALAACGADVESGGDGATVAVDRCGETIEYTVPERAVTYEAGSTDKLLVLGLADRIKGYVMPPANPPVEESPYAAEYAELEFLGDDLLNRELVVDAGADFVVAGWNSGFSDERGITPEILDGLGIQSFMHTESCFNYPEYPLATTPLEGLYTDLERLGRIFGVEAKAAEVIADYRARVAAVEAAAPEGEPLKVFLYDSGTDQPYTAGNQVPPNDIFTKAGAVNVFADLDERWTQVGWESVVESQPDVIAILDYQDQPAEEKIAFLKANPNTKDLPAVLNDRFFILDYNEAISGPRVIDGMESFSQYLNGIQ
ncbi:iron complex transport system substrate-binding protein [Glycomyces sambucus]|uniref:Iron complex transport system substrate-binding protein n=1 Tax=Glycomyces sambucus TaxID=380244 RepID=A0A1G9G474_9ACTN|nr:ABC transporter substrate-binding protein [Glycomyces sambucus]SDK95439.1 iron complex transport system substrate-binding protein [Glycomyces sambucus]